jgi:hypothetical protein
MAMPAFGKTEHFHTSTLDRLKPVTTDGFSVR